MLLCWFIEAAADESDDSELLATELRLLKLFSVFSRELRVSSDRSRVPLISWLLFNDDDWERMCEARILDFKLSLTVAVWWLDSGQVKIDR